MPGLGAHDLAGTTLDGRWTVESRLGVGGMGTVWRAHDHDGTTVAIKVLHPELIHTEDLFKRFAQEADAASRVGSDHIVRVHGFGQTPSGAPYYAMEYCDGPDLLAVLKAEGPMPWRRAFALGEQICAALHAAHQAGIIHRDVKPENFMLAEREEQHGRDLIKVLDFGIAKLMDPDLAEVETRTGVSIGTPEYMAPEQGEGTPLDGRVDVYGVGVLLFQLVTGKVPFSGSDEFEVMQRHMSEIPPAPSSMISGGLPKIVDAVILQALEKDRDHRYADMQRFARSLHSARHRDERGLANEAVTADDAPARKIPWAAIGVALLVIGAAVAWTMRS